MVVAVSGGGGARSYTIPGTSGRSGLISSTDRVIKQIDSVSAENLPVASSFLGPRRILMFRSRSWGGGWRGNVRKLAVLARLEQGWDYPESQPMDRAAEAHFLDWLASVPSERMVDAEPMLTDEGHIRLEWRTNDCTRIAEIGPDSLYLACLAGNREDDDSHEFRPYDPEPLRRFFIEGVLHQ